MKNYYTIAFLHGYEDHMVAAYFDPESEVYEDDLFEYMKQWDMGGENEHSPLVDPPWGGDDTNYVFGEYVLNVHQGLEYAALTRVEEVSDECWQEAADGKMEITGANPIMENEHEHE